MASHEITNGDCNWYTPKWLFDALGYQFDLDPCAGKKDFVPARFKCYESGLELEWTGSVWLNPPYGNKRLAIVPWLDKFIEHGNGIAIVPNRTATNWWQEWARQCDLLLFVEKKIKFIRNGKEGKSPGYGNVLGAIGPMVDVLANSKIRGLRLETKNPDR